MSHLAQLVATGHDDDAADGALSKDSTAQGIGQLSPQDAHLVITCISNEGKVFTHKSYASLIASLSQNQPKRQRGQRELCSRSMTLAVTKLGNDGMHEKQGMALMFCYVQQHKVSPCLKNVQSLTAKTVIGLDCEGLNLGDRAGIMTELPHIKEPGFHCLTSIHYKRIK